MKNSEGNMTPVVELSFLELQTILYMLSDINSIDPGQCIRNLTGSVPFYHLDRFEDLCEIILFKYIDIQLNDDESFDT